MLQKGDKAPDFTAVNQNNEQISLSQFIGKKVVLYFYPKDNTPGCTKEACDLRDNYERFLGQGFVVLGVSTDSLASHEKFAEKHGLPFSILSDPYRKIISAYGVWGEKKNYGKVYQGLFRTTFIINEKGIIEEVIQKVKTDDHSNQIFNLINK